MRSRRRNAPSVPATLQRSASASSRRFSLPENCRRLAFATTSGSRRGASSEAISPAALRAPSKAASEEEPSNPFMEDFSNEVMVMSYLYSKLPETGVSPHIGTEGARLRGGLLYDDELGESRHKERTGLLQFLVANCGDRIDYALDVLTRDLVRVAVHDPLNE